MPEQNIRISYIAFDKPHEEIFPANMTISQLRSYMNGICHTFVITSIQPTIRTVANNKTEDDGC